MDGWTVEGWTVGCLDGWTTATTTVATTTTKTTKAAMTTTTTRSTINTCLRMFEHVITWWCMLVHVGTCCRMFVLLAHAGVDARTCVLLHVWVHVGVRFCVHVGACRCMLVHKCVLMMHARSMLHMIVPDWCLTQVLAPSLHADPVM